MQIQFKSEGGFAFFPGLNKPVTIDTEKLSPQETGELQKLLNAARFFELPKLVGAISPKAADHRRYNITVEKAEGGSHSVQVADVVDDPPLRQLLDFLKTQAAPAAKKK